MIKDKVQEKKVSERFIKAGLKTKVKIGDVDFMTRAIKEININLDDNIIILLTKPR